MSKLNELGDTGDRMMQGLPYGQGGSVPGSSDFDTFSSPDVSQNPNKFDTLNDKSNLTVKQTLNHITPFSPYNGQDPWDYLKDVESIKGKVTPDEVITGIEYELKKLVLKDKQVAKQNVVKNLKKDPKYYSKLHMLDLYPDEKEEALMEILATLKARKHALKRGEYY